MQALKKAERAKQNAVSDEELDKPSEAFDEILALAPEPARTPAATVTPPVPLAKRELSLDLEPLAEFSLEPMAADAPATNPTSTPRPSPDPQPAHSDHKEPGLTMDLALDPSAPATPAASAPAPAPFEAPAPAPAPRAAAPRPPAAATAAAAATAGAASPAPAPSAAGKSAGAQASAKSAKSGAADKPRGAARARAAAAATAEPSGIDPERMRLIGLIAALVLIVGGFGVYYWQAVMAPGAGSRLPPVPMPPPGATGATPVQVIGPGGAPGATPGYTDPQGTDPSADALLAPQGRAGAGRDDLERRLARTEQDLAAAQQAIQAQLSAPRVETLPAVAAPDNSDIRVARAVQPSRVSPELTGAYQAFNSGDLTAAQQQYDTALRQDANNRDALLGLAALAARQNQADKAASYYQRLLELDPADSTATAGLIGLRHGDAGQSESRLKAALAANPEAAPVQFALGNLYAQQGRWSEAQQAYFRAFSAAPDNPDYAYNLAIGLDRLNQGKLALTYYQRALALAQDKAVGFDRNTLRQRMHELGATAH
jgi:tetratricopeptide (TPR) repeat protein